jgi:hypothetical protein
VIEIWKDVVGYEGLYEVSNFGRVRSLDHIDNLDRLIKGKLLSLTLNQKGYVQVSLSKRGKVKKYEVHRLVALTFLDNPEKLSDVNHKDGSRTNNYVENLEWCSRSYNINYAIDMFHKHSRNVTVMVCDTDKTNTLIFGSMRKAEIYLGLPFHTLKLRERHEWFKVNNFLVRVG